MQKVIDPALLAELNGGQAAATSPAPAPAGRAPVFIPNAAGQRNEARDQTRTEIAVEGNQREARRETRDVSKERFDMVGKLSDQYSSDKPIAEFGTSVNNFAAALSTADTPQGDNYLTTLFVKVSDPTSVANVAETEGAQAAQSSLENAREKVMREFQMDGSGLYSPQSRQRMRRELINLMTKRARSYSERRAFYTRKAEEFGLDPELVVGPNAIGAIAPDLTAYDQKHKLGRFAPSQDRREAIPGATPENIAFDIDTGQGAFGSQIEADRLSAPQQAALDAFLKANAGNPNFGPDQLNAFYQSIGIEGGAMPGDDSFFEAVRKGEGFGTQPNYAAADEARRRAALEASYGEIPQGGDTSTVGLEKGLLLNLTDELRGGIGGIRSLLGGEGFMSGYQSERDIERALQERSRDENGLLPELAGGLLTPAGTISRTSMARDAAGLGALAGLGEGEGFQDSVAKAATGGALGYGVGKAFDAAAPIVANSAIGQRVSSALASRGQNAERDAFVDAAARQGLDYLPADIPGATTTQFATSVAKATLGGIPLKDAAVKIVEKAQAARDRIAGRIGNASDNVGAGQAAQRGMEAWERKSAGRGGELFEAIPIRPDAVVPLSATRQALADLNNPITSNPELATLVRDPRMAAYQRALETGDLTWKDIKAFRSYIGEKAGRPTLQQDTSKDSLDALYGALSSDIQRAAASHSPEAAKAFSRANNYWRGRQRRLGDVMSKLVGKDGNMSPEDTFKQLERWGSAKGGDYAKLSRAMRSMPEEDANAVRATIVDRLGDANPGAQGADADSFSPDTFLTQWAKLSPRAKSVLFQGEHRKALDDLATVFEGAKFSRGFDNNSRTGLIGSAVGTGALTVGDPVTGALLAGLQLAGGKLLSSPSVARWIAALGKRTTPTAQLAHINQLTSLARAEPVIANDIFTLQERLADAFAQPSALRSAAEEDDELGNPPPANRKRDDAQ